VTGVTMGGTTVHFRPHSETNGDIHSPLAESWQVFRGAERSFSLAGPELAHP